MMNDDVSHLLNNPVTNKLADIYLSFLDMRQNDIVYRRLKNAVILCATYFDDMDCVYAELAKIDVVSADRIADSLAAAVTALPEPIEDLFNKAYCADGDSFGFMPTHSSTDNIIAFLGKTFLYILETNYPSYFF